MLSDKRLSLMNIYCTTVLPLIREIVYELKWNLFCDVRPLSKAKLLQELHSNLTSFTLTKIYVWEKKVSLTPKVINDMFELHNIDNDDYSTMLKNVDWEMLREVLCEVTVPRTNWIISNFGTHTCQKESLSSTTKVWFYFLWMFPYACLT